MVLYSTEKFKSLRMILVHKQNSEFKGSSLYVVWGREEGCETLSPSVTRLYF